MPRLSRIAPEIPVLNLASAVEYYRSRLGFELKMEFPGNDYAVVERDGIAIHLFAQDAALFRPASVHIFTPDLDDLHAELESTGATICQAIVRKPWGNRDFRVEDSSGNVLKFTEPVSED